MECHLIQTPRKVNMGHVALRLQKIREFMENNESDTSPDEDPKAPQSGAKAQKEHACAQHTLCRVTLAVRASTPSIWSEMALNLLARCVYRCRVCRKRLSRQRLAETMAVSKVVAKPATVNQFKGRRCVSVRS